MVVGTTELYYGITPPHEWNYVWPTLAAMFVPPITLVVVLAAVNRSICILKRQMGPRRDRKVQRFQRIHQRYGEHYSIASKSIPQRRLKIFDSLLEPFFQLHGGLPLENRPGHSDIRLPLFGVIARECFERN
jgi:hypothetical protein